MKSEIGEMPVVVEGGKEVKQIKECDCETWKRMKENENECVPAINIFGIIEGCEDSFPVPISFCPWCGKDLRVECDLCGMTVCD